jgi:hypothetical protein
MEPEGCSVTNHRRGRIQPQPTVRLRNAHLAQGNPRPDGVVPVGMAQSAAMSRHPRRTGGLAALVAVMVVSACGTPGPSPSVAPTAPPASAPSGGAPASPIDRETPSAGTPSGSPSGSPSAALCDDSVTGEAATPAPDDPSNAVYDAIEAQVEELRGLTVTTPVARGVFDTASLCAYLREGFRKDNPESLVLGTELLYRELGLMPEDQSLETLYLDLLTSQVAGLYDDETKHMYVVTQSGEIGAAEKFTYAHEYDHALQDQAFVLRDVIGEATDESDRTMARASVVEGDATLLMTLWAQRHLSQSELSEVAGAGLTPEQQAVLDRMPPILKDPLQFPYLGGLNLTAGAWGQGGFPAVDNLFRDPPDSTEQVLHPDKLAADEAPVDVAFPDDLATRLGDGWEVSLQDTFGELLLEIVLRDAGATGTADAAAGWGGDRVALIEGPDGEVAVVLDTAWDTEQDADQFADALAATVAELESMGRSPSVLRPAPDRVVLVSAESPETMGRVANVLGLAG